ncbi:MAG: NPCBM/NEW2 domain-containing protein [Planctomycetota bacterium]|nr:NPCBM/NEW2 domain-containing protein [Planctomycetota bacterium]
MNSVARSNWTTPLTVGMALFMTMTISSHLGGGDPPPSLFSELDRSKADGVGVVIETIDGKIQAPIPTFSGDQPSIELAGRTVAMRDILSIRFPSHPLERQPREQILLSHGTLWKGDLLRDQEQSPETIQWQSPSLSAPLKISLEDLIEYRTHRAPATPFPLQETDSDQLLTSDGTLLTGILESLLAEGVLFDDPSLGTLTIPWSKLLAFRLVEIPTDRPAATDVGLPVRVQTIEGSEIIGALLQGDETSLLLQQPDRQQLAIPISRIVEIHFELGRIIPLTERPPLKVDEGIPGSDWFPWTWRKDLNVVGQPLQIGSRQYSSGIGVHSRSYLTFAVKEGDRTLVGIAGIDASSRPPDEEAGIGCADFAIRVDGKKKFDGGTLSWKDPGVEFRIELKGAQEFTLMVDLGPGHHILDRANWAMIRIIRD